VIKVSKEDFSSNFSKNSPETHVSREFE